MKVSIIIALRYIFTKRNYQFISIITIISLIGISIGVAALIAVMSIFNGFQTITVSQIIGFDPHITILPRNGSVLKNSKNIKKELLKNGDFKSIAEVTTGKVVGLNGNNLQVFSINAVSENDIDYFGQLSRTIIYGKFSIKSDIYPNIVIGAQIAEKLRVLPGDTISLVSPRIIEQSITSFRGFENIRVVVRGIFQSNIKDYDAKFAIASKSLADRLFKIDSNNCSSINIRLNNFEEFQYKMNNLAYLNDKYSIKSWKDLNSQLYKVMDFEKLAAFSIISIIVVIAAFNILASLSMTVIEKQNDIALLKSLGANNSLIRNIFILEGTFIGLISIVAGSIIGLGFCYGQIYYKWFRIDTTKFIIDSVPITIQSMDIIIIITITLIMTVLATIYPSIRAANTNIVSSIKSE